MRTMTAVVLGLGAMLAMLLAGGVAGWMLGRDPSAGAAFRHDSMALKIEEVRKLASLVTLHVPISDVQRSEISGFTGGVSVVLLVRGDVEIATDLSKARFVDVDETARTAGLVLPRPTPRRARLDHEATRVYRVDRSGLWSVLPGEAGEGAVIDRAMAEAQKLVEQAANRPELVEQACRQSHQVLGAMLGSMGWKVRIDWAE